MAILKTLLSKALANSGLAHGIDRFLNRDQLSILMYHGIVKNSPTLPDWCLVIESDFRAQVQYLKRHFNIVSLSEALKLIKQGIITSPTVVITFDDGYQNNYDYAYPILVEEGVPATIFLATGFIDTAETIWTGALQVAFTETRKPSIKWHDKLYQLSNIQLKQQAVATIKSELKKASPSEVLNEVNSIITDLSCGESFKIDKDSPYRILNSKSIGEMAASSLIEFGAHTHTHPILGNMTKGEQENEISRSIQIVNTVTNKHCAFFAYPNGEPGDYNNDTLSILRQTDIEASLTTIEGTNDQSVPLFELRRFGIGADMDMATFKLTVHNIKNRMRTML